MEITSPHFVIFSILSIFLYYFLKSGYRLIFISLLSCAFIAAFNYLLLPYVIAFSLFNYFIGLNIPGAKRKLLLYRAGIVVNILQLVLLKYASFAIDPVFQLLGSSVMISKISEILVPVGISYFTLQGIGYLINIKMGWEKPESNYFKFLLYISFFPKFLAGPVERSNHFLPQLSQVKEFNQAVVTDGLRIALFGFFKKIAIANQMAPFITQTYAEYGTVDGSAIWLLLFLQPLYLYFDFSGYTDIAIGIAKTFGFELLPNFNRPFFSESVTTFWKRFHISLSQWFNDLIFRQISFKRRKWGVFASTYGVFITFILFGIWHGAGWNFMILGFLQALAINYEFFTKKWRSRIFSKFPDYLRKWFGRIVTYMFYGVSLIFFFSPNIQSTKIIFSKLSDVTGSIISVALNEIPLSAFIFIGFYFLAELIENDYTSVYQKLERFWSGGKKESQLFRWMVYFSVISILIVLGNQVQQFIYVQF